MSAIERLLVELVTGMEHEWPQRAAKQVSALGEEIIGLTFELDNIILNLSEEPSKCRKTALDMMVFSAILLRRIDEEAKDV